MANRRGFISDAFGLFAAQRFGLLGKPTAMSVSAAAAPTSGIAPLTVAFAASAKGAKPPYKYLWSFGDGKTSIVPNTSHLYVSAGTYRAVITATSRDMKTASQTIVITVNLAPPLNAYVTASPESGTEPLTVAFMMVTSGGAKPYSFAWEFGDGATALIQNPTHVYINDGAYTARGMVTDYSGAIGTDLTVITVTPAQPGMGIPDIGPFEYQGI
jgi:PKD repeat protein